MTNMTLALPDELHQKMKKFSEIKWAEVARSAMEERAKDLEEMERIASKSKLTKKDAAILAKKIKSSAAKRF